MFNAHEGTAMQIRSVCSSVHAWLLPDGMHQASLAEKNIIISFTVYSHVRCCSTQSSITADHLKKLYVQNKRFENPVL